MIFSPEEFRKRVTRAQELMADAGLDALLLTTEPEVRYFTGFLTRFWESPTRPWFLVIPSSGDPIAIIPSIGAALMGRSWITDIRTWRSPDYDDDGIGLLANALSSYPRVGVPDGSETHVRMPYADLKQLESKPGAALKSDAGIMRQLRMVKSKAEITKIEVACGVANRAFARVPEIARAGVPLRQVFSDFQRLCLEEGADWVPYLAGGAEQGGYADVISPATDTPLADGDVLMLDTGLVVDGYFCDFDRNFAIGFATPKTQEAHAKLIDAVEAAMAVANVGATAADVFHAMDQIVTGGAGGSDAGRLGHGLGMQLTEWPSLIPADHTPLVAGMVLTLEPGIDVGGGRMIVHEENIVIEESGPRLLSTPAPREMPII